MARYEKTLNAFRNPKTLLTGTRAMSAWLINFLAAAASQARLEKRGAFNRR
jgi:hypothetical protein